MSNKSLKKVKFVKITMYQDEDCEHENPVMDADAEEAMSFIEKKVKVKKLPLGRYAQVMDALQKIPGLLEALTQTEDEDIFSLLPKLVKDFWEDMVEVVSIATRLDREFLDEHVDLEEAVDLIKAVIEVNGFFDIGRELKAMFPGLGGAALGKIGEAAKAGYKKSLHGSDKEESESGKSLGTTTPTN